MNQGGRTPCTMPMVGAVEYWSIMHHAHAGCSGILWMMFLPSLTSPKADNFNVAAWEADTALKSLVSDLIVMNIANEYSKITLPKW